MSLLDSATIKRLREQRGWEQRDLAIAAGVNPSVISRLERDLQSDFKLSVIISISKALGVSVDVLLDPTHRSEALDYDAQLQAQLNRLQQQSRKTQVLIAGMIDGYLTALEGEEP